MNTESAVSEHSTGIGVAADDLDARILNEIQREFPLVRRPFTELGARLGIDEGEMLDRVRRLHAGEAPVIRQISAIFDTRKLGYDSMLVAFKVPPAQLESAAAELNRNPGISHNYERSGQFNIWFTIAVPADAQLSLEEQVARLAWKVGAEHYALLPTLALYKIGVQLDVERGAQSDARNAPPDTRGGTKEEVLEVRASRMPTPYDIELVRLLQRDVPLVPEPFVQWADEASLSLEEVIGEAKRFIAEGRMRRFSAVLRHQKAGFISNGMAVWKVPPERAEEVGRKMASFRAVSHCYKRPTYPHWPYSHFTMIHGRSEAEVEAVADAIARETGITEHLVLYSLREFKKTRVPYFVPEHAAWEDDLIESTRDWPGKLA
ncbi:MAG TPA: AsnC family transcriptional regulator [Gemmatimonadaceae bacterium]|nr:AsnC family transcriptional regulator [Gemmatimonadaceae bacterium]